VVLTALLQTLLHHVGGLLLPTEIDQVQAHAQDHLVLLHVVSLVHHVLDDLVALLVFSQCTNVGHDLLLEVSVQELAGDALD